MCNKLLKDAGVQTNVSCTTRAQFLSFFYVFFFFYTCNTNMSVVPPCRAWVVKMQHTTCTEDRIQHALDRCLDGLRQSPTAAHHWNGKTAVAGARNTVCWWYSVFHQEFHQSVHGTNPCIRIYFFTPCKKHSLIFNQRKWQKMPLQSLN